MEIVKVDEVEKALGEYLDALFKLIEDAVDAHPILTRRFRWGTTTHGHPFTVGDDVIRVWVAQPKAVGTRGSWIISLPVLRRDAHHAKHPSVATGSGDTLGEAAVEFIAKLDIWAEILK